MSYKKKSSEQLLDENKYNYHVDHLGTPIMLTDANQAIAWDATYDPFGKATLTTASVTNNLRFPGQYYDAETGLHYNWHRYYWADVGRYISSEPDVVQKQDGTKELPNYISTSVFKPGDFPDKWNYPASMQIYLYGFNNPLRNIDISALGGRANCTYYDKLCKKPKGCEEDKYPCKAGDCCRGFGESQSENCTRNCLISEDPQCAKQSGSDRALCRLKAHITCYWSCGQYNIVKWLFIPACRSIGLGGLQ